MEVQVCLQEGAEVLKISQIDSSYKDAGGIAIAGIAVHTHPTATFVATEPHMMQ